MAGLLPFAALAEVGVQDTQFYNHLATATKINVVNEKVSLSTPGAEGPPQEYTIKDYVEQYVWQIIRRTKQRRLPLEKEWLSIQRMVVLTHDDNQKYKGRSNAYIPVYKRNRKTLVSQLSKGLFPSDEYMSVVDREQGETEEAKAAQCLLQYEFENSGLRQTIKAFLGQFVDFGISCLKAWYRKDITAKGVIPSLDQPQGMEYDCDEGFTVSTRSMFNVVCYPEWAESKRELQLEAERMEVPISYVQAMHDAGRWENVTEALQHRGQSNDEFDWINTATLADVARVPNTMELRGTDDSPVQEVIVVEAWTKIRLPKYMYAKFENSNMPVPVRIVFINGVAVEVKRNPYWHQSSPFLYARDNEVIGSFMTDGAGNATKDLQYLANDHFNQVNDCMTYGMNPVALVNTNYFSGSMDALRPGRTYKVRDIEKAVKFDRPPVEIVQYGQTHAMNIVAMGQDAAGAPPVLQGVKSANTATSTQILQNNAQSPLQDTVEDIEATTMVPMMNMCWSLARQFRTQEFIAQLADGDIVKFLPGLINAKLAFKFLSSSQAINRQMRQQGLMMFADLAGKLGPNLQAEGMMLKASTVLKRAWTDGLGNRGYDKVIVPIPAAPMMPGQPPTGAPPGMPPPGPGPGGPPPEGQPPISAVPQGNVPGAAMNEPAQGEGDQFLPTRQEADRLAALQGEHSALPF